MSKTSAGAELWHSSHRRQRAVHPVPLRLSHSGLRRLHRTPLSTQGIDQDSLAPPSQSRRAESTREMAPQVHRVLLAAPLPYLLERCLRFTG